MGMRRELLVLYASQTGNAQDAAERIGREAERKGCPTKIQCIDEFDTSCLPHRDIVIFVASTTGQGDTPDSMKVFWKFLLQRTLPPHWLEGIHYAVFGLGDSSYQKYNFVTKKLDSRLLSLGAKAIVDRGLGDDQHPSGYEGALDPWMSSLWEKLIALDPEILPKGLFGMDSDMEPIDRPKVRVLYRDVKKDCSYSYPISDVISLDTIENARSMSFRKISPHKSRPDCFLTLIENRQLTRPGHEKDVRHFEFEIALPSVAEYEVGDVVEILPQQNEAAVDSFIRRCSLDPELYISVQPSEMDNCIPDPSVNIGIQPVHLRSFVQLTMDVTSASPRRYFFEVMSHFAAAPHEKEKLQYFASPEGRDDLYQYNQKERRSVLEVLEDFPSVQMPFEWLVQLVPPLKRRAFSISSSPSVHPNQVHLTVNIVSWVSPFKRKRAGLCSSWLAGLGPARPSNIPAWFRKGSLPIPHPSTPLILIGPGTGCAPFRGFVEERSLQSRSSLGGPVLFFFGCRNEDNDFLYRDFWLSHSESDGVLSEGKGGGFYVAFSRDQKRKIYVQHKMREKSGKIWHLLRAGASVYVAGSSTKMPADVWSMFEEIVAEEGGVPRESATRWLRALEKAGKYHVEAWS